jgi:hypothetical protein
LVGVAALVVEEKGLSPATGVRHKSWSISLSTWANTILLEKKAKGKRRRRRIRPCIKYKEQGRKMRLIRLKRAAAGEGSNRVT